MRVAPDRWLAFARPAKRLADGDRIRFGQTAMPASSASSTRPSSRRARRGEVLLGFDLSGAFLDEALHAVGHMPLPPYIASKRAGRRARPHRLPDHLAREEGAVAAPTAGLHFTPELFAALDKRGIERHFVTLHVGAGTFLPVKADDTADHKMHAESGTVSADDGRCDQRRARARQPHRRRRHDLAAAARKRRRRRRTARGWSGETGIFITPGYRFRTADVLMTNFHLPRSTLFMLVSAFAGLETMRAAYAMRSSSGYRFYSYGDACLLFSGGQAMNCADIRHRDHRPTRCISEGRGRALSRAWPTACSSPT